MTVLVTGSAGFLGRAVVRAFTRDGIDVLATDSGAAADVDFRPGTEPARVSYVQRDLEHEPLNDLVEQVDGVVYAAALTPRDETAGDVADRLLTVNLNAFLDTLVAIRQTDACRRVLFVSSSSVYDQSRAGTLREDNVSLGYGVYGAAKLAAEYVGRQYARVIDREFCAVRPTTLIGPGERLRASRPHISRFAQLIWAARGDRPVHLENADAGDDVLAVDDAADAIVALWRQPDWKGQSFSVSSGVIHSLADMAAAVSREAGLRLASSGTIVDGGTDLPAVVSHDRLAAATGWHPKRTLDVVVRECLDEGEP